MWNCGKFHLSLYGLSFRLRLFFLLGRHVLDLRRFALRWLDDDAGLDPVPQGGLLDAVEACLGRHPDRRLRLVRGPTQAL